MKNITLQYFGWVFLGGGDVAGHLPNIERNMGFAISAPPGWSTVRYRRWRTDFGSCMGSNQCEEVGWPGNSPHYRAWLRRREEEEEERRRQAELEAQQPPDFDDPSLDQEFVVNDDFE